MDRFNTPPALPWIMAQLPLGQLSHSGAQRLIFLKATFSANYVHKTYMPSKGKEAKRTRPTQVAAPLPTYCKAWGIRAMLAEPKN
jgi:hypothetical protein